MKTKLMSINFKNSWKTRVFSNITISFVIYLIRFYRNAEKIDI